MRSPQARVEQDFLGEKVIQAGTYWGVHTARAVENFTASGTPVSVHPTLVAGLGAVKMAAVRANLELGLIDLRRAGVIERACQDVMEGRLDDQFVVDVLQGGAGTSTNMNANEVIANRALELRPAAPGDTTRCTPRPREPQPEHQRRLSHSPEAGPARRARGLSGSVHMLAEACEAKSRQFWSVPKVGRTQLQDAVPMTVGQEFAAWAATLVEEQRASWTHARCCARSTSGPPRSAPASPRCRSIASPCAATWPRSPACQGRRGQPGRGDIRHRGIRAASGVLKRTAVKVSKICNDLRLLSWARRRASVRCVCRPAGRFQHMPGKVNPVIPEMVNQVAFSVIGNDVTVTMAAEAGQLQLNAFEPVIAHKLLQGISWITTASRRWVSSASPVSRSTSSTCGPRPHEVSARHRTHPHLGYAAAADIAKAALAGEGTVRELVLATGLLDAEQLDGVLHPERLAGPRSSTPPSVIG